MHPDHPQGWIRNEAVTPPRVPVETLFLSPARSQQHMIVNYAKLQTANNQTKQNELHNLGKDLLTSKGGTDGHTNGNY